MLPTFPSRYWSTIGLLGVFSLAGWSPRFLTGFLVSRHTQVASSARLRCPYRGVTSYARPSQTVPVPSSRSYPRPLLPRTCLDTSGLGSSPFARHYSGNRCFFLLLQVLRCFSSLRSLRPLLPVTGLLPAGLPHSDTPGSLPACGSPGFFAACRVLPRLQKPRHPPSALIAFFRLFLLTLVFRLSPCEIVFSDLFFFYLVICFQYVNELSMSMNSFQSVISQTGCKDTDFLITSKFF